MTKKRVLIAVAIVASLGILALPVLLGLVAVLFGASAQAAQNPCYGLTGPFTDTGGPVRLPVVGTFTPTSEYGMRVNPGPYGGNVYKLHNGIDLVEMPGPSTIVAAKDGQVTATPNDPTGGGNMIVLDHGAGLTTTYMHLASRTVTVGEKVWAGRPIGTEGSTGNSTGAHLHFTVKINGVPTDPRPWFAQNGITLPATKATGVAPPAAPLPPSGATSTSSPAPTLVPIAGTGTAGDTKPVVNQLPAQVGAYQGEQVLNAAYVIKAGQALGLDAKSITIGVMTAMGESGLRILDYGDAAGPDSRGLFQQRDNGAWGSYSDRMNPTISSTNFFKALMQVPNYLALEPTIAAHKTQGNADPYYYAPFWAPAVEMVSVLTADPDLLAKLPPTGPIAGCDNPEGPLPAGDGSGAAIVAAARHYLGTPYSWGGGTINGPSLGIYSSPSLDGTHTVGFDCSGLVLFAVHNSTGLLLAHSAETQGHDPRGTTIARDWAQLQPGDIIAFSRSGGAPGTFGHVGIYIGNKQMINAPQPGSSVEIDNLDTPYWAAATWAIKRYTSSSSPSS